MNALWIQFAITGFFGVSLFFLVWAVFRVPVTEELPTHRRFAHDMGQDQSRSLFEHPWLGYIFKLALLWARRLKRVKLRAYIRQHLDAAGNPNNYSVDEYLALCLVCAVSMCVATLGLSVLVLDTLDLVVACCLGALGFWIPLWTLRGASASRVVRISKQLPYTMDLIALMMGAGSTFTEAVQMVLRDQPDEDFNQELDMVLAEMDLGASRSKALENMATRIPLDALRSVIGAVNQAESLGTPLSTILKNQADMMRMHRSVRAEKLSASASLRLMFPNVLILMAVVIFLFGPLIIKYIHGDLF